jgi:predicted flap endonuclease-1-like 5' DNA nuclease
VAPSCTYELSFRAALFNGGAVAELSWRDAAGAIQRIDTVPIRASRALLAYRLRMSAPAAAVQAEVRFRATEDVTLELEDTSLAPSSNAVSNHDLQVWEDGAPVGWRLDPATSAAKIAVWLLPAFTGIRNADVVDVTLSQTVPATAGERFLFEVETIRLDTTGREPPPIELDYLRADDSRVGPAIVLRPASEDAVYMPVAGTVPEGAMQAEIRLIVPHESALVVRSTSLRFFRPRDVPIRFVAEAPGELRVTELRVGYDREPVPAPPVPPTGLRAPTPAAEEATDEPCDDSHCVCCGAHNSMTNAERTETQAGKPASVGTCRNCGAPIVMHGGEPRPTEAIERSFLPVGRVFAQPLPTALTIITGIGKAREQQLIRAGIDSFEKLATAKPRDVAKAMIGVPVKNAPHFINEARRLVEAKQRIGKFVLKAGTPLSEMS